MERNLRHFVTFENELDLKVNVKNLRVSLMNVGDIRHRDLARISSE